MRHQDLAHPLIRGRPGKLLDLRLELGTARSQALLDPAEEAARHAKTRREVLLAGQVGGQALERIGQGGLRVLAAFWQMGDMHGRHGYWRSGLVDDQIRLRRPCRYTLEQGREFPG